jgi:Predicted nucleotide-binding protein containing TIR-like domain
VLSDGSRYKVGRVKKIFIGSSSEAFRLAEQVGDLFADMADVEPLLWRSAFKLGDITFLSIEGVAREVAGAVFLATPDDQSVIRDENVNVPRANVLFEYGYLTARLARNRVALCRYNDVELPSDFQGLTYVPMGNFDPEGQIDHHAVRNLRNWAEELPVLQDDIPSSHVLHGYSGLWDNETVWQLWRGIEIEPPDFVQFRGNMLLHIPPNGDGGTGTLWGNLYVLIGDCYAEFQLSDTITNIRVFRDGSLQMTSEMQSRQRIKLEGDPPQKDGFEHTLRGVSDLNPS